MHQPCDGFADIFWVRGLDFLIGGRAFHITAADRAEPALDDTVEPSNVVETGPRCWTGKISVRKIGDAMKRRR